LLQKSQVTVFTFAVSIKKIMVTDSTVEDDLQYERVSVINKNRFVNSKDSIPAAMLQEEEQLERAEILSVLNFLQCMEKTGKSF